MSLVMHFTWVAYNIGRLSLNALSDEKWWRARPEVLGLFHAHRPNKKGRRLTPSISLEPSKSAADSIDLSAAKAGTGEVASVEALTVRYQELHNQL